MIRNFIKSSLIMVGLATAIIVVIGVNEVNRCHR